MSAPPPPPPSAPPAPPQFGPAGGRAATDFASSIAPPAPLSPAGSAIIRGLGCLPLLWGLLFLMGGVVWWATMTVPSSWVRTQGTYTSVNTMFRLPASGGTASSYVALVSFSVGESAYTVKAAGQAQGSPPAIGDHVSVAYDPANPRTARVLDGTFQPESAWVFALFGSIAVLVGLVWLIVGPLRIIASLRRRMQRRAGS